MDEPPDLESSRQPAETVREQLQGAVRDLWSMVAELGDDHVVFLDRRRLKTSVTRHSDGRYGISWQEDDGAWSPHDKTFENPREAAFHAYQGPH